MKIRTVLLDDDVHSLEAAAAALSEYPEIQLVGRFSRSEELFDFLDRSSAHLLFLDIELQRETGFTVAEVLRTEYPSLMIVFLTGHSTYAIDGYDFHPVDFLTKPIHPTKLKHTLDEVQRRLENRREQPSARLMFRLAQGYRIFSVRDIVYIEHRDRKNDLHTADETVRLAGYSLHDAEAMLAEYGFFLCHQSFLISLYRVEKVIDVGRQLYEAHLQGSDKPIPVSRIRYEELMRQLREIDRPVR
jgi:DNA-binding LytR/AlgR family response regulator